MSAVTAPSPPQALRELTLAADTTLTLTAGDVSGSAVVRYRGDGVGAGCVHVQVGQPLPAIALQPAADALEGSPFSVGGQVSDPGSVDTLSATVDYGGGAVPLVLDGTAFTLSHAYLQPGEYTLTARSRGQERTASFRVE